MRAVNPVIVSDHFLKLEQVLINLNLKDIAPEKIWNCDETGFQFQHKPTLVCARKGSKNVSGRTSQSRESISVLVCGNANGAHIPPMVVVKGKTYKSLNSWAVEDSPPETVWTWQEKAWMENLLGVEWFTRCFLKHCGDSRPQLLILDGHKSHESLELLEAAKAANIDLYALPPHTTSCLQPMDKTVFGPLKKQYNATCSEYLCQNPSNNINKASWPKLFTESYDKAVTTTNIISGFKSCGIHPFNSEVLSKSAYAPSLALDV